MPQHRVFWSNYMRVLILGSGVIGTTVAYYLARAGHEVAVVERQPGPGLETSYANAGEVSPGYSAPWAGPGVPLKAVQWLLMQHSPLVIKPMLDSAMWRWSASMLRNCTEARYRVNKGRMVRLAEYSRDCLKALRADIGIQYDDRSQGTLQLFRTQKQLDGTAKDIEILKEYNVPYQLLDRTGYLQYEPALAEVQNKFVGALRLPGDETGDCFKFTNTLAERAKALGVKFRFGVDIQGIEHSGNRITGVRTAEGVLTADRYVLTLGSYSTQMLAPLGIRIPVYPVKGFSITVPITNAAKAPDDTRRHAHSGRNTDRQPVPEHRPRHTGLDHGGRHRARDGRPDQRPPARDQFGRPDRRALRLSLWGRPAAADNPGP
jgi:D-amino-acid dehydrogenase